jgi:hypothetical protein
MKLRERQPFTPDCESVLVVRRDGTKSGAVPILIPNLFRRG